MDVVFFYLASVLWPLFGIMLMIPIFKSKYNLILGAFGISIFMAVIAYNYTPASDSSDLVRYYSMIDRIKNLDFKDAILSNYSSDFISYTYNFLMWICVKTNDYHLLPAITTFIVYYIAFTILFKISKYMSICLQGYNNTQISAIKYSIIIICCLNWKYLANNVRNVTALSLVCYAVFRELVENKKNITTYFLYVIAIFLHPTTLIFIFLRLALFIKGKIKFIFIVIVLTIQPIIVYAYTNLYKIVPFGTVKTLLYLGYKYFTDTNSTWGLTVQASLVQNLLRPLHMLLACYFIYLYVSEPALSKFDNLKEYSVDIGIKKFQQFGFYTALVTLSCMTIITPAYWRFSYCSIYVNSSLYLYAQTRKESLSKKLSNVILYAIAAICLALAIWVNREELLDLIISFKWLTTSPLIIIIRDLLYSILY